MLFVCKKSTIRSFRESDTESIARYANNRKIWLNLRDAFPHPYTVQDAKDFIEMVSTQKIETTFAICIGDDAVGSIGFGLHSDVERKTAEIGYWLAEPFWNRGIMTEALNTITEYAFKTHQLTRIFALPFEWNQPSMRVLEKAGYRLEGRMKKSAIKDNKIIDQLL